MLEEKTNATKVITMAHMERDARQSLDWRDCEKALK